MTQVQPQAGAFETPGRGIVDLAERLEQLVLVFRLDADPAIDDFDRQSRLSAIQARLQPHQHFALGGEFDRIVDQVDHDLA